MRKTNKNLIVIGLSTLMLCGWGCTNKQSSAPSPIVAVSAVTAQVSTPIFSTELSGRTSAIEMAEVRPQVGGIILKKTFTEGQEVKAGQQLFQIDPTVYRASYNQTKASMALAQTEFDRVSKLYKVKAVSKQAFDKSQADLENAKAAFEVAKANLYYTMVLSPISGRVSRSEVTPGALVTAYQDRYLTTVVQMDPIYVDVRQSSTEFLRIKKEMREGIIKSTQGSLEVTLITDDGSEYPLKGKLTFKDESVDPSTGMINLRAVFSNPNKDLLPGMYVRARIEEGERANSILINQRCVMHDPRGQAYVYIINKDKKIERRNVVASRTVKTDFLIESGLSVGEVVLIEGIQKVRPGAVVRVTELDGKPLQPKKVIKK